MKRCFLISTMFVLMILVSCKSNDDEKNNENSINIELEKVTSQKNEIEVKLQDAKIRIKELEKQIHDLEEPSKHDQEVVIEDSVVKHHVIRIAALNNHELKYVFSQTDQLVQSIIIVGENNDEIIEVYEAIEIKGVGMGETLKVEVFGSIYDVQLIKCQWNDDTNKLEEQSIIHTLGQVRNQTLFIETYLPCGIPQEKITWKDSKGNQYEVVIANDGYGFDGSIIWTR